MQQPAEVTVEASPKALPAELRQVIPTADRTKATVMVKVTILDRDPNLKPEMSAKANVLEKARAGGVERGALRNRRSSSPRMRSSRVTAAQGD
jgi:hypothetical protein